MKYISENALSYFYLNKGLESARLLVFLPAQVFILHTFDIKEAGFFLRRPGSCIKRMRRTPESRSTTALLSADCLLCLGRTLSCFDTWTLTCWVGHLAWINIARHRLTTTYQREETQEMTACFLVDTLASGSPRPAGGSSERRGHNTGKLPTTNSVGQQTTSRHEVWSCIHSLIHSFTIFIQLCTLHQ